MEGIKLIKGFLWIRHDVFDNPNLNSSDIMVYAVLMRYMNNDTKRCFPSIKILAEKSRLSKDTVIEKLKVLEKQNLIAVSRELGKVNNYLLLEPNQSEIPTGSSRSEEQVAVGIKEANNTNLNYTNNKNNSRAKAQLVPSSEQKEIIAHLNKRLGKTPPKGYKDTNQQTLKLLDARLKDYTKKDIIAVIDVMCNKRLDTEWQMYLRPSTLFDVNKFEGYINSIDIKGSETTTPIPLQELQ